NPAGVHWTLLESRAETAGLRDFRDLLVEQLGWMKITEALASVGSATGGTCFALTSKGVDQAWRAHARVAANPAGVYWILLESGAETAGLRDFRDLLVEQLGWLKITEAKASVIFNQPQKRDRSGG
ncbi:MAG: hypothetical protein ACKPGI_18980, partial [Verrucomicrobiota bacterium]